MEINYRKDGKILRQLEAIGENKEHFSVEIVKERTNYETSTTKYETYMHNNTRWKNLRLVHNKAIQIGNNARTTVFGQDMQRAIVTKENMFMFPLQNELGGYWQQLDILIESDYFFDFILPNEIYSIKSGFYFINRAIVTEMVIPTCLLAVESSKITLQDNDGLCLGQPKNRKQ
ncbi:hypothetical protein DINM_004959 [Dirofilaria immitis]|nr:hypothetical protein [Dirofilaria immitis]